MTEYHPDDESAAILGSVNQLLLQSTLVSNNFSPMPAILTVLPGGELYFDTNLELDTDGWKNGADMGDPDYDRDTSLTYDDDDDSSLDSNRVPYFVLPLPSTWPAQFQIRLGDYAVVIYRGVRAFAVFGDEGPKSGLGEGSIELLRRLGKERIQPDGTVINAGMGPGIITIVFPGSGPGDRLADEAALLAAIDEKAEEKFDALVNHAPIAAPLAVGADADAPRPGLALRLVAAATREFADYGGCPEGETPLKERVGAYWMALNQPGIDGADHDSYWSAAFVSYMVYAAQGGASFLYNDRHSKFVHQAIKDLEAGKFGAFWGYRPSTIQISPGDILAMNRGDGPPMEYEQAQDDDDFDSHSDIVVQVDQLGIHTIGGNVGAPPGTVDRKIFRWVDGVLRNSANHRQEVYAVLRPPIL